VTDLEAFSFMNKALLWRTGEKSHSV